MGTLEKTLVPRCTRQVAELRFFSESFPQKKEEKQAGRQNGRRCWRWLQGLGSLASAAAQLRSCLGLPPSRAPAAPPGRRARCSPRVPVFSSPCLLSFIHKPGGYRRSLNIDVSPPTAPPLTQLQNSSRTVLNYLFPYSISISLIKSYNV